MSLPPPSPRTIRDFVLWAEQQLEAAGLYYGHGTDNALDEAAWLVAGALAIAPDALEPRLEQPLSGEQAAAVRGIVAARIRTRKPAAYLLHQAWFAGERFYVDERALVPRSLVGEFILERFEPWLEPDRVHDALDLCTGSGCIAVALARAFPRARVDAADISAEALAVAEINVREHGLADRIALIQSDLYAGLAGRRYDLIVANPPYVDAADMAGLPAEYRHEPALALAAGADGLAVIRRILAGAADHLGGDGILVVETGNSRPALEAQYARVPFLWLVTESGDESVFLLTAEQCRAHQAQLRRLAAG